MANGINIDPSISLGAKPPATMTLPDMLNFKSKGLPIISNTAHNQNLDDYYDLKINLNYKFPYKRIFLNPSYASKRSPERTITQRDFQTLINEGTSKNRKKYPVDVYQFD
jgi:hypothetical protein